ncbi:BirA family biotin operon repressor/biotin-[acetyl-CoA-carboxylase] ligase [Serinibacter salmoneus]|uniref:biotin--[biotin carboxyl-carrier protein] ligase n=1 Tax=Serinibacter salmoneus TaxID=556530 RepID=A0A2A9D125_9MICO|nr:BirA family biotin operon repressor/biotin-[acetyl-CoA-carboxylase] ligase [Serinibacter salmoneus]
MVTLASCGSTNTELLERRRAQPQQWPHLSVLRAEDQRAGRGRLDREWVTPPGQALTASLLLEPDRPLPQWPTLSLVAALAVVRALRGRGLDAAVKWPNDVIVRSQARLEVPGWGRARKVAGILAQVVPAPTAGNGAQALVLGIGVNCEQREFPVPWATSLAACGAPIRPATMLGLIGIELTALLGRWRSRGFVDLRAAVTEALDTLGQRVEVQEAGARVVGDVVGLEESGSLVLRRLDGRRHSLTSGDVSRVRRAEREAPGSDGES